MSQRLLHASGVKSRNNAAQHHDDLGLDPKHTAQYLRALYRAGMRLNRHGQYTHDAIGNYLVCKSQDREPHNRAQYISCRIIALLEPLRYITNVMVSSKMMTLEDLIFTVMISYLAAKASCSK